jgi:hypothetical protein
MFLPDLGTLLLHRAFAGSLRAIGGEDGRPSIAGLSRVALVDGVVSAERRSGVGEVVFSWWVVVLRARYGARVGGWCVVFCRRRCACGEQGFGVEGRYGEQRKRRGPCAAADPNGG